MFHAPRRLAILAAALLATTGGALAQSAQCGGDFGAFLQGVRAEARAKGLSEAGIERALADVRPDPKVLARDRGQGVFQQAWTQFQGRMVNKDRLARGQANLRKYASTFAEVERQTGVPGPVIASFWGLETDYGAVLGDFDTLSALATLAHDCRRPEIFRPHLIGAIELVDRGYLRPDQMRGAWAGELGQTQILPEDYLAYGTDQDGNGQVNLLTDVPDVLMTTGKFIQSMGYRRGEPWLESVRIPANFPYDRAALVQKEPRSEFAKLGVTKADGSPLESDGMMASIILPQGAGGPAFLAFPNFDIYLTWNNSLVYSLTAAYFGTRLAGEPAADLGNPQPGLDGDQMKALQQRLAAMGYDVGKIDGILGANTRAAVREEQMKRGLPADGWPTARLLAALN
ncbi:lytic murein transglycosylase [Aureimonas jatrophae]|jgi:lytic murein transglycosylase|uniref:Lytic murein transglycosylase n=1 Tax=Aureimonas jatrophae TaxID=1166073 RepID=A0A1H0CCH5_9HYPH|nr:lytic murein transglycosylase [Aureimonas jatrophae]MBB3949174.1 lytic murein transglycosylase [Aureimonas jatrophae]SDN55588.1 lytic murein transglycosylase [Aureimonas jatrophae]